MLLDCACARIAIKSRNPKNSWTNSNVTVLLIRIHDESPKPNLGPPRPARLTTHDKGILFNLAIFTWKKERKETDTRQRGIGASHVFYIETESN